eukprot:18382-Heterococcus_DN1.PRE.3
MPCANTHCAACAHTGVHSRKSNMHRIKLNITSLHHLIVERGSPGKPAGLPESNSSSMRKGSKFLNYRKDAVAVAQTVCEQ